MLCVLNKFTAVENNFHRGKRNYQSMETWSSGKILSTQNQNPFS